MLGIIVFLLVEKGDEDSGGELGQGCYEEVLMQHQRRGSHPGAEPCVWIRGCVQRGGGGKQGERLGEEERGGEVLR